MTSWTESTHTSLKRLFDPLASNLESHCRLAYPVLVFQPFRAWFRCGTSARLKQQYLHQVPRTKQSSVTDSSGFLSIALTWFRKRHVTLVTSERYVHLSSTGSISPLSQCDAPGLCPNRSGTSLGVPALGLHAYDVTLEVHHIMFSWLTSEQIQCDSIDDSPCNWCQHHNLACTFDRVRGRRKPAAKSRLVSFLWSGEKPVQVNLVADLNSRLRIVLRKD